jgi:hypothetical protein
MRSMIADLVELIGAHVRHEREDLRVLHGPWAREEIIHHVQGAQVVFDHEGQEETVELDPAGGVEAGELLRP